jgi:hypothetical protein
VSEPSHLLICVANEGAADLQVLKIYRRLPDEEAASKGFVRVLDDSGEDFLYPESAFLSLSLPPAVEQQLKGLAACRSPS